MRHTATTPPTQTPAEATREPSPRRNWFILGLAAVLLIVAAGVVGWRIGSTSNDTADVGSDLPQVVQQYFDALMDGEPAALARLFTIDGVLEGVTEEHTRSPISGPTMIQFWMAAWLSFVDITHMEHQDVIVDGNTVVVVSRWSGDSSTHARGVDGDKTPFSTPVVNVFELDDTRITRCYVYYEYDQIAT